MKKIVLLFFVAVISELSFAQTTTQPMRPTKWAQPVKTASLRNIYKLNKNVYRCAQPDETGFAEISRMGIKTVLSLREYHSDENKIRGIDINLCRVKIDAGSIKDADVIRALTYIAKSPKPILIHCWHGADRTGLICAMYRIIFQGWSKKEAIDEMVNGGYGFHEIYSNIPRYIEKADIKTIKKKLEKRSQIKFDNIINY
ncbi:MAG: tyrosine-protein phosphatase [Bacteroidota bacterium]|nr:tyrosine-protein phosphatase [Bacteroidota bacterium]MDP4205533.1 tyrosine-protein phosphatase [Bacteroidota bacterium]